MAFHSPEVLGFTTTWCGGSWQTIAYASEGAVASRTRSKEQMGARPAAAPSNDGASCVRQKT